ncbi:MAG: hypothetical protein GX025_01295, partial [Clostridiales bacterium]|nr:hypothetical protein [Clostridiales bacterium]
MKKLSLLILSLLLLFSACAPASSEISRPPSVEHIESTPKPTVEPEP